MYRGMVEYSREGEHGTGCVIYWEDDLLALHEATQRHVAYYQGIGRTIVATQLMALCSVCGGSGEQARRTKRPRWASLPPKPCRTCRGTKGTLMDSY